MTTIAQHLKNARKKRSENWAKKTEEEKQQFGKDLVSKRKWRPVKIKYEK